MSENAVTLVGNLTEDPELRYTAQGAAVANFNDGPTSVASISKTDRFSPSCVS